MGQMRFVRFTVAGLSVGSTKRRRSCVCTPFDRLYRILVCNHSFVALHSGKSRWRLRRLLRPAWPRSNTFCLLPSAVRQPYTTRQARVPSIPTSISWVHRHGLSVAFPSRDPCWRLGFFLSHLPPGSCFAFLRPSLPT